MSQILQDLLAFSRVTTQQKPFTWTRVKGVMHAVISDLDMVIAKTEATVEVDAEIPLQVDARQLRQLLNHLVMNAIKFRREGVPSHVRVTCDSSETETDVCRIVVEDNGNGFEQQYAERIFRPFERLNAKADYPGTGMGLAICRRIIERHTIRRFMRLRLWTRRWTPGGILPAAIPTLDPGRDGSFRPCTRGCGLSPAPERSGTKRPERSVPG